MQALVRLVPDSPIRVSAHLQPCRYTTTTALPKDATALLMRSLHHARVVCPLRLDGSQLEAALMMLRPASLGSWGLRDTAISVFDVEVQVDTAEGKEQPSVCCVCCIIRTCLSQCSNWLNHKFLCYCFYRNGLKKAGMFTLAGEHMFKKRFPISKHYHRAIALWACALGSFSTDNGCC